MSELTEDDEKDLLLKIAYIEDVFCKIRDHQKSSPEIRALADFGQGRAMNLRGTMASLFEEPPD